MISLQNIFRDFEGPLTAELVQKPAAFGLGNVPASLMPDAVATSICGFCSTGCSLQVHLKNGRAVNLTANSDYPVNIGMACPKGWEALTPLAATDRATTPLLRNAATDKLEPVDWHTALTTFTEKFRHLRETHGQDSIAWLGTGQMPSEELAFLGALAKFGLGFVAW
jgi:anaerobic selenocysteine-containing dehydrogenase